ncbi:hypothetical protein CL614_03830 [archaeon]|nr:hypothetical protein [archaeon]|tara:strand:- start:911 stop:1702 length:792 start_codon:yes stop_codon:yes gene_type:complete
MKKVIEEEMEVVTAKVATEYLGVSDEELITAGTDVCPGCGVLLGLRLAMKTIGMNSKIIASGGHAAVFGTTSKVPFIATKELKIPNLRKEVDEGKEKFVVLCYDGTNKVDDIVTAAGKCDLVISVVTEPGKDLVKKVSPSMDYSATASVSNPVDFMEKVQEGLNHDKSFIELLAPCPGIVDSKLDPSNTIEAARMAVKSNMFPLLVAKHSGKGLVAKLTYQNVEPVSVDEYHRLMGEVVKQEIIEKENADMTAKMRLLQKGKF